METMKVIEKRCSVRSYSAEPVEQFKVDAMLEALRLAPSAVNRQPWQVYVVQSEEGRTGIQASYDRDWFRSAPLYFVLCGNHTESWKRADGKDHCDIDVAIAAEHLILEATELGLGSCWVCNFKADVCRETLKLTDDNLEPVVIIPVGYPSDVQVWDTNEKKRKPMSDIVSYL